MINKIYDNYKVKKPWGEEHVVLRAGKSLCVTLLNIKYNKSTSLHCHQKKKTGFIVLSGKASITLGLEKEEKVKLKSPSKLMIRNGLFHSIKSISKDGLFALEFESPVDKNDIVRFRDKYGRKFKQYEKNKQSLKKINKNDIVFKFPKLGKENVYYFKKYNIIIEKINSLVMIRNRPLAEIYAILQGSVIDKFSKVVLGPGDVVKMETLKKLSDNFKLKSNMILLRLKIN